MIVNSQKFVKIREQGIGEVKVVVANFWFSLEGLCEISFLNIDVAICMILEWKSRK